MKLGLLLAAAVVVLDQASKAYIATLLDGTASSAIEVLPFFNLVAVWNYGVSFGMFNTGAATGAWILTGVALAIVAGLAIWLFRVKAPLVAAAIGIVIGGAIGNVIDRVRIGAVFDFADFHVAGWHWPAFNVADSAITVGVIVLLIDGLFSGPRSSK